MGGGDLNSKKSWHPNTIKNQERVWKAEQAAAQEKQRIVELQRERAAENDRAQLKDLMLKHNTSSSDDRLSWMYDKPDKKVDQEEYLLGKSIDKNAEQSDKPEDAIPAVSRRVVGSSMLATATDTQVDLARKIREDPLLLIKERERAARAALLNNPLQRRKLTELLRKEQEQKKESKLAKKPKKKGNDLDSLLAEKLTALGSQKGINIATLLGSDSSSDSSSEDEKKKKKKKKQSKEKRKAKKKKRSSSGESDSADESKSRDETNSKKHKNKHEKAYGSESRKRKSSEKSYSESKNKKSRENKLESKAELGYDRNRHYSDRSRDTSKRRYSQEDSHKRRGGDGREGHKRGVLPEEADSRRRDGREGGRRGGLSEEARAAKLAEMAAAGAEREEERGARVAAQRAADEATGSHPETRAPRAPALPDSLQARIHSNRHNIQRDKRHMNEHFARR